MAYVKKRRKLKRRNFMKALPRYSFDHNGSSVEIRRDSIKIVGKIEDAAFAMAEELLKRGKTEATTHWEYPWSGPVMQAHLREGKYSIELLKIAAIDAENWKIFKSDVEKICNKLKAFM
jgi:hypothetical protein